MANIIEKAGAATALTLATAIASPGGTLAESPTEHNNGSGAIVDTNQMFQPSMACNIYQSIEMGIQNNPATIEKVREELVQAKSTQTEEDVDFDSLGENLGINSFEWLAENPELGNLEIDSYDWITKNPKEAVNELGMDADTVNSLPSVREIYLGDLPEEYCPTPEIEIFTSEAVESVDTQTPEETTE